MGKYNVNQQLYALGKYMSAYEAVQEGLGKRVEIRILSQRAQEGSIELSRFQSEIKNLANLDHPAILRVLDCGVANGKLYYVVELKRRLTMQELMAQTPPPPVEERLKIAVQIAAGLKYMHGKGIIHRGVDDVSVNYDPEVGQAYISQFSFVKNVRTDNLTSRGIGNVFQLLTTPEGAMGQPLDARSDVFLLGVLAFKMMCGQDAYSQKAFLGLTDDNAGKVQQRRIRELDPQLLEALDNAIAKASAVLPANRYQTMAELHDALVDAQKKLKLPKWADRKELAQPAPTGTMSEADQAPDAAAAPASGAGRTASTGAKPGTASSGDARSSRVQSSRGARKSPNAPASGKGTAGDSTGAATTDAAPASATGGLLAQIAADPRKKKIAIGVCVLLFAIVAMAAFALLRS